MVDGIIKYDDCGKPICEICGKSFKRVISHVRQVHDMNERDYKTKFGFDLKKGICSNESKEISRKRVFENYEKCISSNLIGNGSKSRFVLGSKGRTKEKVSAQTRIRLKERLKEDYMVEKMSKAGKIVGETGLGNLARWKGTTKEERRMWMDKIRKANRCVSKLEWRVRAILNKLNIQFAANKFLFGFNYDLIFNNKNILEINGDFWHCNPQKYKPTDIVRGGKSAQDVWDRDSMRRDVVIKNGYNIFYLWESEINKMSDEQIKEFVINTVINHG